jgi:dephospho-CoA kinase
MAAQASDAERRAVATHLVDNGGDLESLTRQVDDVWKDLLTREVPEAPPETPEAAPEQPEPE